MLLFGLVWKVVVSFKLAYFERGLLHLFYSVNTPSGLSLRAGGQGFSSASKRVTPGYFHRKIEEK